MALNQTVYLWNASSGDIQELLSAQGEDYITSLSWAADGKHLGVGFSNSLTQIWDAERCKPIRNLNGHSARVSAMSWNNHTLSTGGRDSAILNHDVRVREHITATLRGHEQEVCGLKWSPNGTQVGGWGGARCQLEPPKLLQLPVYPSPPRTNMPLSTPRTPCLQLASGGNDNLLMVWDAANDRPTHRITAHQAAVKALAWCPFQANLLATGGGTADRTIKFHNTHTGGLEGDGQADWAGWRKQPLGSSLTAQHQPTNPSLLFADSRCLQGPSSTPLTPAARSARCSGTATSGRSCLPTASGGWVRGVQLGGGRS